MSDTPIIILETSGFERRFDKLGSAKQRSKLYQTLAANPKAGDVIRGSGGIRKLRLAREGMGKRGGLRIIYYFFDARGLLSLLTVYAKNVQDDLTPQEIKQFKAMVEQIKQAFERQEDDQ